MLRSSARRQGESDGCFPVVVIVLILAFVFCRPEAFRTPAQVPASISIRSSLVGIGNVVQVRNLSAKPLTGVMISAKNAGSNTMASYRIETIAPGAMAEVGWLEWDWKIDPNETITVRADGYLPIVFTSQQLGIK